MKKKSGFVLVETIVVVTVLCVILVVLYRAFSSIITNIQRRSLYDNTEYIYKTEIVRDYLLETLPFEQYNSSYVTVVCDNETTNKCSSGVDTKRNAIFNGLNVYAVYITVWNTRHLSTNSISSFQPTTQHYIASLDPEDRDAFRVIVMYKQENNDTSQTIYEYASLQMGSEN